MAKVNIRESLGKLDIKTDNKYDLRNMYDSMSLSMEEKKKLAEAISNNKSPKNIYNILNENLNKVISNSNLYEDFDDDTQLYKVIIKSGAVKHDFESGLSEKEAWEIIDYHDGRWVDEDGYEWKMEMEEDDDSVLIDGEVYYKPALKESSDFEDFDPKYDARYEAKSYYDGSFRGLEDDFYTDDFEELKDWVWSKAQQNFIKATDRKTGKSVRIDTESYDWESDDAYGVLDDLDVISPLHDESLEEDMYDEEDSEESDFNGGEVREDSVFIEDGKEWAWLERIAGPIHLDFDNWAVWEAMEFVWPGDFIIGKNENGTNEVDIDAFEKAYNEAEVAYFVVDEDTGFIDWGPVENEIEAIDFLNGKQEDWDNDEYYGTEVSDDEDYYFESLKEDKFVPQDKMSKKKQKELNNQKRSDWGNLSPVTRKAPNGKAYDRNREKRVNFDEELLDEELLDEGPVWDALKAGAKGVADAVKDKTAAAREYVGQKKDLAKTYAQQKKKARQDYKDAQLKATYDSLASDDINKAGEIYSSGMKDAKSAKKDADASAKKDYQDKMSSAKTDYQQKSAMQKQQQKINSVEKKTNSSYSPKDGKFYPNDKFQMKLVNKKISPQDYQKLSYEQKMKVKFVPIEG